MAEEIIDPTQLTGAPHPRETVHLIGQEAAESDFLDAFMKGRLHHAWLIIGPRGVGKATLAWRIARFLLASPDQDPSDVSGTLSPKSLDIDPEHPVAKRVAAGSESRLKFLHRTTNEKTNRLRDQIITDDVRSMANFFNMSATDGGRRIVIIDAADNLNPNAANALLKMLEEPPERTTLLLICHQPTRLLPTIVSRCRTLRLKKLTIDQTALAVAQAGFSVTSDGAALAELSSGSVGEALRLSLYDGLKKYNEIIAIFGSMPNLDRSRVLALAEETGQRGAEGQFDLLYDLIEIVLTRLARTGATGQPPTIEAANNEAAILSRLATNSVHARVWAEVAQTTLTRARRGKAVNLDPAALVLDTFFKFQNTASML